MKIYLVRHGQTEEHAQKRRQRPDSLLSKEGKEQARAVAKRISQEEIDLVLSSPWPRARKTAEIIAKKVGKPLELFDYIREKEQHPDLYEAGWDSAIHTDFEKELHARYEDLDWKFRDGGESLRELSERANKFRKHLEKAHLGQNIVAVSHGDFIRSFVGICVLGEDFDERSFGRFCRKIRMDNTGVSLLEYKEEEKFWRIRFLNEHLHLIAS